MLRESIKTLHVIQVLYRVYNAIRQRDIYVYEVGIYMYMKLEMLHYIPFLESGNYYIMVHSF